MNEPFTVMGVVNVTPDSFSDGGLYLDPIAAIEHGLQLERDGAGILDVGGESTRPGAESVPAKEELARVLPVIEGLVAGGAAARISIDTSKAVVAAAAIDAGARLVNDVTALRGDPEMARTVAEAGVDCCLMHMLGEPRTMQDDPRYDDVVSEVKRFLEERLAFAVAAGIREELVCLDPGIGFGKTAEQNFELVRRLDELVAIGRPVLIGFSRKSSLGKLVGSATGTAAASVGAAVAAFDRGATILRVHDVREHVEALAAAKAIAG
jgi:dihydropteroate synthase